MTLPWAHRHPRTATKQLPPPMLINRPLLREPTVSQKIKLAAVSKPVATRSCLSWRRTTMEFGAARARRTEVLPTFGSTTKVTWARPSKADTDPNGSTAGHVGRRAKAKRIPLVEPGRSAILDSNVLRFVRDAMGDPRLTWWEANFVNSMANWVAPTGPGAHR